VTSEEYKLDATLYSTEYELLRSQLIGPSASAPADPPRGIGLALFLSEGMPGWLKSVAMVLAPRVTDSPATPHDSLQPDAVAERFSGTQRNEISTILAGLILSTLPAAHTSPREGHC
jgi:hypothetical protein